MKSKIVIGICALALPLAAATVRERCPSQRAASITITTTITTATTARPAKVSSMYMKGGKCKDLAQEVSGGGRSAGTKKTRSPARIAPAGLRLSYGSGGSVCRVLGGRGAGRRLQEAVGVHEGKQR